MIVEVGVMVLMVVVLMVNDVPRQDSTSLKWTTSMGVQMLSCVPCVV